MLTSKPQAISQDPDFPLHRLICSLGIIYTLLGRLL